MNFQRARRKENVKSKRQNNNGGGAVGQIRREKVIIRTVPVALYKLM